MSYKPETITIAGVEHKIQYCDMEDFGDYTAGERVIRIRHGLSDEDLFYTLMHECVHAVLHLSGQAYTIGDPEKEEGLVRSLEHLLFPVFEEEMKNYNDAPKAMRA